MSGRVEQLDGPPPLPWTIPSPSMGTPGRRYAGLLAMAQDHPRRWIRVGGPTTKLANRGMKDEIKGTPGWTSTSFEFRLRSSASAPKERRSCLFVRFIGPQLADGGG